MAKKMIRPIRTETEYDEALEEIERYFESEPKPGTPEADRFDLLARRDGEGPSIFGGIDRGCYAVGCVENMASR